MRGSRGAAFRGGRPESRFAFIGMAVLAQFWTPYDPQALNIVDKLQAPGWHHWFGTDQLGRDVLSMIMAGAKNSVGVALLSVVIGLGAGVPLGLLAAARGGAIDEIVMRGNEPDLRISVPFCWRS